ncbi:hypothetical protein WJX73_010619 [Symbiochloris irregularis]|uniref:V-ATPase proteolipid subunit C-like domain-containing protein n=1 Tax=Symbiochloris irregularis TaxID=706552 RepID=A0AAW1NTH6_9CHLO
MSRLDAEARLCSTFNTYESQRVFRFGILEPNFDSVINWDYLWCLFKNISPYYWTGLGVALCVGLSIGGAAWGIYITGSSLLGAAIKVPRITSKNLISIIFCEAVAIYGVIVAIILQTKITSVTPLDNGFYTLDSFTAAYAIFAAGLVTGWSNLACGVLALIASSLHMLADRL